MDLAGEVEALAESASAFLLPSDVAGGRHERGGLAERPQQVALAVGELESPAAAVGADHAVGVATRAERGAHERGDPEQLRVLGGNLLLDPVRDDHDLVLEQRALGDRRVDKRRPDPRSWSKGMP